MSLASVVLTRSPKFTNFGINLHITRELMGVVSSESTYNVLLGYPGLINLSNEICDYKRHIFFLSSFVPFSVNV